MFGSLRLSRSFVAVCVTALLIVSVCCIYNALVEHRSHLTIERGMTNNSPLVCICVVV